ncbi:hypothetical protein OAO99_04195 [Candidatus Pelagibacter sp.]|nr:hypothetical protein [Candidatus Pelagibacter sp.]
MDLFSNKKKIFFSLFGVLFFLIIIEIFSFILLNIFSSEYKSKEKFNVREFNELVNDDRFFTMKKEISLNFKSGDKKFSIITDKYGFRINNLKKKRYDDSKKDKFIFIGDSVPFGWGVNAEFSLPEKFNLYNQNFNIINAAIPSYSLSQAIVRFEKEIIKLENIKYVYLQIFDPAITYSILGNKWKKNINWANLFIERKKSCLIFNNSFLYKSYFINVIQKFYNRIGCKFKFNDESNKYFSDVIKSELSKITIITKNMDIKLIIAPVNPPISTLNKHNAQLKNSINIINDILRNNQDKYGYIFFDTRNILLQNENENFIDKCCHLSNLGADKVAKELNKIINKLTYE